MGWGGERTCIKVMQSECDEPHHNCILTFRDYGCHTSSSFHQCRHGTWFAPLSPDSFNSFSLFFYFVAGTNWRRNSYASGCSLLTLLLQLLSQQISLLVCLGLWCAAGGGGINVNVLIKDFGHIARSTTKKLAILQINLDT